ncbi:MAG: hypothetical protein LBE36_04250 [Flavobacteriaceae bacterium]|jgi:hypothetical protein|nr:hypothetical protein [Flavobacteriaceae bacterium]
MKSILFISSLCILFSCSSQKNKTEIIRLHHINAIIIGGDEVEITLIPKKSKRKCPVIVKIFRDGESYDRKRISYEKYQQIRDTILTISQEKINIPQNENYLIAILDGGSNSIYFKKDTIERKFYTYAIIEKYHGSFYRAAELILNSAKMDIRDID